MEITELKKQIKSGQFDKVYIFCGEEWAVMKLYLKMIADNGGYEISYVDSLMDLMTGAKTKALVPVRHLYIIMDDKEYLTNEKMQEKFKGLKDDVVVFYYTTTDKRLKFWKQNKDKAVEFNKLDEKILIKYIQKEIYNLSESSCKELIEMCDNDYGRILLELDKVIDYWQAINGKMDENKILNKFIDEGVIYRKPQDAIFAFVDAVLERNPAKAYSLLAQSKAVGEANLTLLSVLYTNVKLLLQVKSYRNYTDLGLNNWQVLKVRPHTDNYTSGELLHMMRVIRECEKGIKTGAIPDELSVDYVMVMCM